MCWSSFTLPSSSPPVTNISPNVRGPRTAGPALLERHDDVGVRLGGTTGRSRAGTGRSSRNGVHVAGSRWSKTYFPRRSTFVGFRLPSSRAVKSLRFACRRITRIAFREFLTSAARPSDRPRPSPGPASSTSGSSTPTPPRPAGRHVVERLAGRSLLGFLLRPADPDAERLPAEVHRGRELLLVVRAALLETYSGIVRSSRDASSCRSVLYVAFARLHQRSEQPLDPAPRLVQPDPGRRRRRPPPARPRGCWPCPARRSAPRPCRAARASPDRVSARRPRAPAR